MEGKQIKRLRWWLYNAFTHYIVKSQINCLNFNSALNFREKNTRKQMCRLSMNWVRNCHMHSFRRNLHKYLTFDNCVSTPGNQVHSLQCSNIGYTMIILKDEPPLRAIPKSTELQHFQFDHNDGNLNIVLKIRILQVFLEKKGFKNLRKPS